jgi:RND family efflux transporter MFP subunit
MNRNKGVYCLCVILACACGNRRDEVPPERVRPVRGAPAVIKEQPNEINGAGTLSFLKKVDIAAPQDAVLGRLFFREGDVVRAGDRVAVLENPQIMLAVGRAENAYTQAGAALELARSRLTEGEFQAEARILSLGKDEDELAQSRRSYEEMERKHQDQEVLFAAGGISEETIRTGRFSLESEAERLRLMEKELDIRRIGLRDQDLLAGGFPVPGDEAERRRFLIRLATATLRAEHAAAGAQLEAAAKELESARVAAAELVVRSPSGGTVGARYFETGERLKREDTILSLIDTESLYAVFPVRETEALSLRKGMPARVYADSTGENYEGTVDFISPVADSQSFTFSVRALLPPGVIAPRPGTSPLKPGMFVRVSVTLGPPRMVLAVPESSLVNKKDNQGTVFVIQNGILSERKVGFGASLGEDREIQSGLVPGEVVVVRPDTSLRDGAHVSAVD